MTCRAANTPKPAAASRKLRQRRPRSGSRGGVPWGRPFLWETQQLGWGLLMARSKRAIRPAVAAELPLTSQTLQMSYRRSSFFFPLWSSGRTNHITTQHCPMGQGMHRVRPESGTAMAMLSSMRVMGIAGCGSQC